MLTDANNQFLFFLFQHSYESHATTSCMLTCFGFILDPLISLGFVCARLTTPQSSFLVATADSLGVPDTDQ